MEVEMNTGLVNTHVTTAKRNNLCIVFILTNHGKN